MMSVAGQGFISTLEVNWTAVEDRGAYPFNLPVAKYLGKLNFHPGVTYFVGENSTGKSTLLEAIALNFGLNPEGGSRNFNFSTLASHSSLGNALRLGRNPVRPRDSFFLRAESLYNVASEIDRLDNEEGGGGPPIKNSFGGKSLHEQSHGESFYNVFLKRLGGPGLYLLDEPESALSPARQLEILARIHQLVSAGSQFVIATHSPITLAYPEATIYEANAAGMKSVTYDECETFRTYRAFMGNPNCAVRHLLDGLEEA